MKLTLKEAQSILNLQNKRQRFLQG